jgi:SAM-dependent methyltransferase
MSRTAGDAEPPSPSVSHAWFAQLYRDKPDPWDLATKWHDRRKYAVTVASLPRPRYRSCYEPGCSIGELTKLLADRCDRVLAVDFVEDAVAQARDAVRELSHVRVELATLPDDLPNEQYDLIVVSELLYYLSHDDMQQLLDGLVERLEPDGDLVAVHYRNYVEGGVYDGFNVHGAVVERTDLMRLAHHEDAAFILDVLRRPCQA